MAVKPWVAIWLRPNHDPPAKPSSPSRLPMLELPGMPVAEGASGGATGTGGAAEMDPKAANGSSSPNTLLVAGGAGPAAMPIKLAPLLGFDMFAGVAPLDPAGFGAAIEPAQRRVGSRALATASKGLPKPRPSSDRNTPVSMLPTLGTHSRSQCQRLLAKQQEPAAEASARTGLHTQERSSRSGRLRANWLEADGMLRTGLTRHSASRRCRASWGLRGCRRLLHLAQRLGHRQPKIGEGGALPHRA